MQQHVYKLILLNIDGKRYNNSESCVRINDKCIADSKNIDKVTEWFECTTGLKQGCNLSPTIFSVFANDLVRDIYDLNLGIEMGDVNVSIPLYAGDIVLISQNEENLQTVPNTLPNWRMIINTNKSKCMLFRKSRAQRSDYAFIKGDNIFETAESYKCLGITFHEKCLYFIVILAIFIFFVSTARKEYKTLLFYY